MIDTTQRINTKMDENQKSLLAPANTSCSPCQTAQPCLCGENSEMTADKPALIALYSETSRNLNPATLSERLTPLLISAGLVRGTTLMFGLRLLNREIPAGVSYAPDGSVVVIQKGDCIFWKKHRMEGSK